MRLRYGPILLLALCLGLWSRPAFPQNAVYQTAQLVDAESKKTKATLNRMIKQLDPVSFKKVLPVLNGIKRDFKDIRNLNYSNMNQSDKNRLIRQKIDQIKEKLPKITRKVDPAIARSVAESIEEVYAQFDDFKNITKITKIAQTNSPRIGRFAMGISIAATDFNICKKSSNLSIESFDDKNTVKSLPLDYGTKEERFFISFNYTDFKYDGFKTDKFGVRLLENWEILRDREGDKLLMEPKAIVSIEKAGILDITFEKGEDIKIGDKFEARLRGQTWSKLACFKFPEIVYSYLKYGSRKWYPSLEPRSYILVDYKKFATDKGDGAALGDFLNLDDLFNSKSWVVTKKKGPTTIKINPDRIVQGEGEEEGKVLVILKPGTFKEADTIFVTLKDKLGGKHSLSVHGIKIPEEIDYNTYQIDPAFVPDQELTNGEKSNLVQVKFKINIPALNLNLPQFFKCNNCGRLFIKGEGLLSSDSRDLKSRFDVKTGAIFDTNWKILPVDFSVQAQLNGNQQFTNGFYGFSGGMKTKFPWKWTHGLLSAKSEQIEEDKTSDRDYTHSFLRTTASPELELRWEYINRLADDTTRELPTLPDDHMRGFGELNWRPVYLLPGFSIWKLALFPSEPYLEFLAKGWHLPEGVMMVGRDKENWVGRVEVSLVFMIATDSEDKPSLENILKRKKGEQKFNHLVRLKWSDGSNETNNYAKSSQFTINYEFLN